MRNYRSRLVNSLPIRVRRVSRGAKCQDLHSDPNGTKLRRIWDDSELGRSFRAGVVTIYIPRRCPGLVWGAPLVLGGLS